MRAHPRRSLAARLRRSGDSRALRCILAAALAQATLRLVTDPLPLGRAASFVLACASAAAALVLLLSLVDDDRRVRRLAARMGTLAHRDLEAEGPTEGLGVLDDAVNDIAATMASIEQRLLHRHPVSGLPTREPLFKLLARAIEDGAAGLLGVVHLLDLERLRAFDEPLSEQVLTTLADRIVRMVGAGATVAQVDRARIAIWFGPELPPQTAETKLQAIGYALGEGVAFEGREILPEVRVSSAQLPADGASPALLLARATVSQAADRPAIAAAADATADPLAAAQQRYALEQDLRRAIARAELELAYQPLLDAQAGTVCGAEALLRWRHPVHGLVPPTRFVPIMEQAGLASEIGLWVVNTACREAASWARGALGSLRVAVNISGHQLEQADLVTLIERTLARHSLSSDRLEIELTETVATSDADRVSRLFGQLRRLGVAIAIDDFGTGYSSLSTLRTLRFDKIKIDREFVTAVDQRRDSQAICRSILTLGQGLGIRVLAEGVETAEEYRWLRAQGCRHFQGYYFARPLDPEAFRAFVRETGRLAAILDTTRFASPERLRA